MENTQLLHNQIFIIKKDFMSFLKDDEMTVSFDGDSRIYFNVKRIQDYIFYGNENGEWGKNNPAPKSKKKFICPPFTFKQETVSVCAMVIKCPEPPYDKNSITQYGFPQRLSVKGEDWRVTKTLEMLESLKSLEII